MPWGELRAQRIRICCWIARRQSFTANVLAVCMVLAGVTGFSPLMRGSDADAAREPTQSSAYEAGEPRNPHRDRPCAEQTWPYLSGGCLRGPARQVRVLPSTTSAQEVIVHGPATEKKHVDASAAAKQPRGQDRASREARAERMLSRHSRERSNYDNQYNDRRRGWSR